MQYPPAPPPPPRLPVLSRSPSSSLPIAPVPSVVSFPPFFDDDHYAPRSPGRGPHEALQDLTADVGRFEDGVDPIRQGVIGTEIKRAPTGKGRGCREELLVLVVDAD